MTASTTPSDLEAARPGPAAEPTGHRRPLVVGSRTALLMLLIAGIAILTLGVAALVLADPPEVDGWLRSAFGTAFGSIAVALSALIGIPALVGIWAIAGATADGALPALPQAAARAMTGIAVATVATTAVVVLVMGSGATIIDLGLIGIVALMTLGLTGAATLSPHRGRAILAATAMLLITAGTMWVLVRAFAAVGR